MGRLSPGKWIRNLLLGKKTSSKKKDVPKPSSDKDVMVVSSDGSIPIPSLASPPTSGAYATKGVVSENEDVGVSSNEKVILAIGDEETNSPEDVANFGPEPEDPTAKIRLTEAAIIAQAAFRGYQARRKFRVLKGIIPLQALIRGMLVRREAVSALYCVKGIVKFQALVRGYKVRQSGIGLEVQKICKDTGLVRSREAEKLSDNTFVLKLLASSSPSTVSQHLKYDSREPDLAWEWLNRWTRSHFWAPLPKLKKLDSVSETVEPDERKVKRFPKKDSNNQMHSPNKEHSQKENEKSNSKKSSMQSVSDKHEVTCEKRKRHTIRKSSDHTVTDDTQNDKNFQRRASLPANFTNHNNDQLLQETTPRRVPSYMAPTESAKAKLRGQGSPSFNSDLVDKNGINRRLSLSSSLNGKLGLFSPRSERLVAMSNKTDSSLSSSRDWTDKFMQPQWRR